MFTPGLIALDCVPRGPGVGKPVRPIRPSTMGKKAIEEINLFYDAPPPAMGIVRIDGLVVGSKLSPPLQKGLNFRS